MSQLDCFVDQSISASAFACLGRGVMVRCYAERRSLWHMGEDKIVVYSTFRWGCFTLDLDIDVVLMIAPICGWISVDSC